jgi:hypothetical protein
VLGELFCEEKEEDIIGIGVETIAPFELTLAFEQLGIFTEASCPRKELTDRFWKATVGIGTDSGSNSLGTIVIDLSNFG